MISYMLVYHPKPEGPIISELYALFKFGYSLLTLKEGPKVKSDHTITFRAHDFLSVIHISYEEIQPSTYDNQPVEKGI